MRDLAGKVAVVTGGASGIGRALCDRFAAAGMKLVLADVERPALERAVAELAGGGAQAVGVPTDVRDPAAVRALADRTLAAFGAVHVVCNNAGVLPLAPILETSIEDWRWLVDVNLLGVAWGVSVFGPILVEQGEGHIVNTASAAGLLPPQGLGAYAATKHAVVGLSETLYLELQGTGVGVSVLCPALVNTRISRSERNRPAGDHGPRSYGDFQERFDKLVTSVGHPAEEVAERVLQAILADQLFVLPHDEVKPVIEARWRRILAGENPPRDAMAVVRERQPVDSARLPLAARPPAREPAS
jgi:NAD(P)-dependent dehydrogenase (short-subunit alcohol dehydrogenase family)